MKGGWSNPENDWPFSKAYRPAYALGLRRPSTGSAGYSGRIELSTAFATMSALERMRMGANRFPLGGNTTKRMSNCCRPPDAAQKCKETTWR
jgi:hypothetical protein